VRRTIVSLACLSNQQVLIIRGLKMRRALPMTFSSSTYFDSKYASEKSNKIKVRKCLLLGRYFRWQCVLYLSLTIFALKVFQKLAVCTVLKLCTSEPDAQPISFSVSLRQWFVHAVFNGLINSLS